MNCPCLSGKTYALCCALYIEKNGLAPSPEALMRSRYSAYALNKIDYIVKTMRGTPLKGFSKKNTLLSNKEIKWVSLDILNSTDTTVNFKATCINEEGKQEFFYENSLFKQKNNQWFYIGAAEE